MNQIRLIMPPLVLILIFLACTCVGNSQSYAPMPTSPASDLPTQQVPAQQVPAQQVPASFAANCKQNPGCRWVDGRCQCPAEPNCLHGYHLENGNCVPDQETPNGECDEGVLIQGQIISTPNPCRNFQSGSICIFDVRIDKVVKGVYPNVVLGQIITVHYTSGSRKFDASVGDCIELCATWDTNLYCGDDIGYIKKITCFPGPNKCTPGPTGSSQCHGNVVLEEYQKEDCSREWQTIDNCNSYNPPRRCENGRCVESTECNHLPTLTDAKVTPDCGPANSLFKFSVTYKQADGIKPVDATIRILGFNGASKVYDNGYNTEMTKGVGDDARSGINYYHSVRLPRVEEYHYILYFTNNKGCSVYLPPNGFSDNLGLPGPRIDCSKQNQCQDIKFQGEVIKTRQFCWDAPYGGGCYPTWEIQMRTHISGPKPSKNPIPVIQGIYQSQSSSVPELAKGYIDKNIVKGDNVEVYGCYHAEEQSVSLSEKEYYYIKKLTSSQEESGLFKICVMDKDAKPLAGAQVSIDGKYVDTTNSKGEVFTRIAYGWHKFEAKRDCGSSSDEFHLSAASTVPKCNRLDILTCPAVDPKNSCLKNRSPNEPSILGPDGTKTTNQGGSKKVSYRFSSSTKDPEGDMITYRFDWGDGQTTNVGPVKSGQSVTSSHVWNGARIYKTQITAIDRCGSESKASCAIFMHIV